MSGLKEQIERLCTYVAPSGAERELQEALLDLVRDIADEVWMDTLGNGIARKHGSGPHVMLTAHADETGVMVIHVDDDGFLRLISIGALEAQELIGRRVEFVGGLTGVVQVETKVDIEHVGFDHLYVDIGAENRDEALQKVKIGLSGVVVDPVVSLTRYRLAGRALDNRVGCAVAASAFRALAANGRNVSVVFTAQGAVGARGARPAAVQLEPDLAFVVDAAPAGDAPGCRRMELKLGQGPAIKVMDGTSIIPLDLKRRMETVAEKNGIPLQYEVWPRGVSEAGSVQLAMAGIPTAGISYPARYVGAVSTVVDLRDAEAAVRLLTAVGAEE
ncbi:MAG: peptidase M42 [Alicyclobacillus herbarius]|uniref:peptidase M42 n=1 Tax=Alicyclobacillus herbarius TaxID=122960 RepID=UPI002355B5C3|nr:peptidase M42 [Alicyclobacillus herbarius]MCL6632873.1 peptidase M42 [Alicyclobacillus herbarius]